MPTEPRILRLTDPVEALVVERALALVRRLRQAYHTARHGHGLDQVEIVALTQARQLIGDPVMIAAKHCLQATDVVFDRAAKSGSVGV